MKNLAASISTLMAMGLDEASAIAKKRPYINHKGQSVVALPTGRMNANGEEILREVPINTNATLRKDEWLRVDEKVITAFRERLVIVEDLRAAGLTFPVGGLGVMISEWENASEITDAAITMDGESKGDKDRQEFGLAGVPIPVVHKEFDIGERVLLASRTRGGALDVTTGTEAARSVARTSENMVFNGVTLSAKSAQNQYSIYGLTNFPGRETISIADWSLDGTSAATILSDILAMIQLMETEQRRYGPFTIYIPAEYSFQFYRDFKTESDKTLMQRVLEDPRIKAVKVADALAAGNVIMVQLEDTVIDLAVGSDVSNVQWASGSGWTNHFQVFAAWAPRLKTDFDGRTGILHATPGT